MKTKLFLSCLSLVVAMLLVPTVQADLLTLSPDLSAVAASDGSGLTKVALTFDLTDLPANSNILDAHLDWTVTGVDDEAITEFAVYAATASWTEVYVLVTGPPAAQADPSADWLITPLDYDRNEGFVRFVLTDVVSDWNDSSLANHGLVLEMADLSATSLASQTATATLVIHYESD
ncbi:MAG: DNRLRE domain-containing protein [Candidatus Eisenbacteria bacterium]|uniref:DNRLRE domain-containing protein n=1 Tax=Eiseniibacteriota bacterium TaxID=2212470 RepID=A0A7Y2H3V5_UNCEI|nr:DNRLRE domain-containing protein [Candidatus Eisenbacteria bacterium]